MSEKMQVLLDLYEKAGRKGLAMPHARKQYDAKVGGKVVPDVFSAMVRSLAEMDVLELVPGSERSRYRKVFIGMQKTDGQRLDFMSHRIRLAQLDWENLEFREDASEAITEMELVIKREGLWSQNYQRLALDVVDDVYGKNRP